MSTCCKLECTWERLSKEFLDADHYKTEIQRFKIEDGFPKLTLQSAMLRLPITWFLVIAVDCPTSFTSLAGSEERGEK